MNDNLMNILEYEKAILEDMLIVILEQKEALIKYDVDDLESINKKQEELSKQLLNAEKERINFIQNWLKLSKSEALELKLSALEKHLDTEKQSNFQKSREYLNGLIQKINELNSINRVLTNRARHTIHGILTVISGGNNHVCNVQI